MPLEVLPVTTEEQLQLAFAVRSAVFVQEQQLDGTQQFDAYDRLPNTYQFFGRDTDTGKVVATTRCFVFADERKGKVGRVAVLSECRGKNYGLAIMTAVENAMLDKCDSFVLSAQCSKRGFYEKCGYTRTSDPIYDEMGIDHCLMVKYVQRQGSQL